MRMVVTRTILAALITISVALMPATGGAAVSTMPVEMSMPNHADMPCCPYCNEQNNSKSSVACAFKCVTFVGAALPIMVVTLPYIFDEAPLPFAGHALHTHVRSPPTRPPLV
jgi:hypothetical protein